MARKIFVPAPEEGSEDWIWYYPARSDLWDHDLKNWRLFQCYDCDVTWKAQFFKGDTTHINCWSCGKFMKLPNF